MLLAKKMRGQPPFCCSASISVPGAPASSLRTESQLVVKPGGEICAPDWVAFELLCTFQPPEPRLTTLLAPASADEIRPVWPAAGLAAAGWAASTAAVHASDAAPSMATARNANRG